MSRLSLGAFVIALAVVSPVRAQVELDHLQCFKVKDTTRVAAVVDLASSLGATTGCKVSSRSVELCVPASKAVRELEVDGEPTSPSPQPADPAAGAYVCYRMRCPDDVAPGDQSAHDQFATRVVRKLRPARLCTPATLAPIVCGPVTCPAGLECCNPLLGICVVPGQPCVQQ